MFDGLKIFPGMETDIAEGGHVLSIGPMEAILELNHRLEPYKAKGAFLPAEELMELLGRMAYQQVLPPGPFTGWRWQKRL